MPDDPSPPPPSVNNGIMNYGGVQYIGNQAVGQQAQASSNTVSFDVTPARRVEATDLLDQVKRVLDGHEAALSDPDATRKELSRLRGEFDELDPQASVLQRALDRLDAFAQTGYPARDRDYPTHSGHPSWLDR